MRKLKYLIEITAVKLRQTIIKRTKDVTIRENTKAVRLLRPVCDIF